MCYVAMLLLLIRNRVGDRDRFVARCRRKPVPPRGRMSAAVRMSVFGHPVDVTNRGDQRRDARDVAPHLLARVGTLLLGFHIHDVVLLQVVAGREEEVFAPQVVGVFYAFAALLADDMHAIHAPVGRHVARLGDGLQQGDAPVVHVIDAGAARRTEHGVAEVEERERDEGIFDVFALDDAIADEVGDLAHLEAVHVQRAEDGELDVAVQVHAVARGGRRELGRYLARRGTHLVGSGVERGGQFGVLAAHGDGEAVVDVDHGLALHVVGITDALLHVLQIDEVLVRLAGTHAPQDCEQEQGGKVCMFHCFESVLFLCNYFIVRF